MFILFRSCVCLRLCWWAVGNVTIMLFINIQIKTVLQSVLNMSGWRRFSQCGRRGLADAVNSAALRTGTAAEPLAPSKGLSTSCYEELPFSKKKRSKSLIFVLSGFLSVSQLSVQRFLLKKKNSTVFKKKKKKVLTAYCSFYQTKGNPALIGGYFSSGAFSLFALVQFFPNQY